MAVRPTAVRLCAPDAGSAHLLGHVADTAFRGRHYELVVDLPAGKRLTGVLSERRVARGTPVGLQLDAAGCVVFPAPRRDTLTEREAGDAAELDRGAQPGTDGPHRRIDPVAERQTVQP